VSKGEGAGTAVVDPEASAPPLTPAAFDKTVGAGRHKAVPRPAPARLPVRIRVTFDEPGEFLQELGAMAEHVEGDVVRFIVRYNPPGEGPGIRNVELVAGAVVAGEILELVGKCGQVWGDGGELDQETKQRVDTWHGQLVELCSRTGLALKGGRFGAV
jgi:hypothetical protein